MEKQFYAVVQGNVVFGVGNSKKSACVDAENWTNEPVANLLNDPSADFEVVECTESIVNFVTENGGQGDFFYNGGNLLEIEK